MCGDACAVSGEKSMRTNEGNKDRMAEGRTREGEMRRKRKLRE